MKKVYLAVAALVVCGVAMAANGPLFSQAKSSGKPGGPTSQGSGFTSVTTGINSNGFLTATFKDVLASSLAGDPVEYTLTADAAANWVCATGGGGKGKQQASPSPTTAQVTGETASNTYTVPNNGTVSGGIGMPPPQVPTGTNAPTCNGGTWELGSVAYQLSSTGALMDSYGNSAATSVYTGSCIPGGTACSQVFIKGTPVPQP